MESILPRFEEVKSLLSYIDLAYQLYPEETVSQFGEEVHRIAIGPFYGSSNYPMDVLIVESKKFYKKYGDSLDSVIVLWSQLRRKMDGDLE